MWMWVYNTSWNRQKDRTTKKFIIKYSVVATTEAIYFLYCGMIYYLKHEYVQQWITICY